MILCVNCGHRNRDRALYCTRCGVRIADRTRALGHLIVMSTLEKGRSFSLSSTATYIGRGEVNDIVLKDEQVSQRHARFVLDAEHFWVEDVASTNGTFLNGTQVDGREMLKDEDLIKIGTTILKFKSQ